MLNMAYPHCNSELHIGSFSVWQAALKADPKIRACLLSEGTLCGPLISDSTGIGVTQSWGLLVMLKKGRLAMDATELRAKTPDQLRDDLVALKKEAFNLRFQQATGQLENTSRMRSVRRDAARVKTILNEKAAAAAKTEA